MKAWHFVNSALRDGSPVPADGVKLKHTGKLVICQSGFHASKRSRDALSYAPGNTICRVELGGEIVHDGDKSVAAERTILWRLDGEELLRRFARKCALDVIRLWDAPDVVVQYLKTGDDFIRAAARDAARDAGRDAWAATRDATWAAAWDAAWAATGAAVWDAARAAAWDAAWAATWYAARAAAWDATGAAARAAARAATGAAARAAAWDAQNRRLTSMVVAAHRAALEVDE